MALRSLLGTCATLTTAVTNLTVVMVLHGEPGWICFTLCNLEILFSCLVLHWITNKEQKEEDSTAHSGIVSGRYGGGTVVETHRGKDVRASTIARGDIATFSYNSPTTIVTTECKGKAMDEDEVELNSIRVNTVHTIEIEVDGEGKSSVGSDGGDEWVGSRKGVVGERMV
jgi:hypothetical protein